MRAAFILVPGLLLLRIPAAAATESGGVSVKDEPGTATQLTEPLPVIPIAATETVVFYGDSITEQNLYSAYLETFLVSRFPHKKIVCFNFGWGGDTAEGGHKRFDRDVAPVAPSLVFVNFGMNDGGYQPFKDAVCSRYLDAQRVLAAKIRDIGARQVLFTASPVDERMRANLGAYNDTLARLGQGVAVLAAELNLPVVDLFQPMIKIVRLAREREAGFTMIPDGIHPDPVGHLVMAYLAMRQIDAPREVGEIVAGNGGIREARGVSIDRVVTRDGGVEFDMTPPFLPFYVPAAARKALDLVPLQDELNRFRLRVEDAAEERWALAVDGVTVGTFTAAQLRAGIDLALLDKAPWCVDGRTLWETAQFRWQKHQEAWRRMGLDKPATMMPDLPSFEPLARAQRAYADDLGRSLSRLAQPRTYRVGLWCVGDRVPIQAAELSPAYPFEGFDKAYPPELDSNAIAWQTVALENGILDLGRQRNAPTNVISYVRILLEAESDCKLHLSLGSDDGIAVLVHGKRVFAHDVARALRRGEDETEIALHDGRNEILFMVSQRGGDYGLSVEADVRGKAHVRQRSQE